MSANAWSRHVLLVLAGFLLALPLSRALPQGTKEKEAGRPAKQKGQDEAMPVGELYPAGTTQFSSFGLGAVVAGVQCDLEGNIYLVRADSIQVITSLARSGLNLPITRLSPYTKTSVQFPVGAFSDYAYYSRRAFYVAPGGTVYGLVLANRHALDYEGPNWPDSLVVKYRDDGTVDSVVKLEPPQGLHLSPYKLAYFLDGNFLVTGALLSDEPRPRPTEPFTWIFDRGGGFVGPLTLQNDVGPEKSEPAAQGENSTTLPQVAGNGQRDQGQKGQKTLNLWQLDVQQGFMVGSPDGSIYLLRASTPARLYTISSAGTVLREVDVKPPGPGMRPSQSSIAGQNHLLVEFTHAPDRADPQPRVLLALVDPSTGMISTTYDMPKRFGIPACAKGENRFLFLGENEKGQLEVATFVPR